MPSSRLKNIRRSERA